MNSAPRGAAILFLVLFGSKVLGSLSFHSTTSSTIPRVSRSSSSRRISTLTTNKKRNKPRPDLRMEAAPTPISSAFAKTVMSSLRGGALLQATGAGAASCAMATAAAMQSGPLGVAALTLIGSFVIAPLTLYRQGYSFSVGYGFGIMAMGLSLLKVFWDESLMYSALALASAANSGGEFVSYLTQSSPILLVASMLFYGFRLGSFLLLREWTVPSKQKQIKSFDKSPPLKRIPFSISVSIFYAFMVTPVLYSCRQMSSNGGTNSIIALIGAIMAWSGALLESVADFHKFLVKRGKDGSEDFVGPMNGVYAMSRHPNYLGEIMYWSGILVAGVPSFKRSPIAWICSTLGFVGIYKIMTSATDRLEKKQDEAYGSQQLYKQWKMKVSSKLFPTDPVSFFVPSIVLLFGTGLAIKLIELICKYATGMP